jgi:hypothetical protein
MEDLVKQLRYETSAEARERILGKACGAMDDMATSASATGRPRVWRITMNTKTGRCALAAAVLLIVLGGITLWPSGDPETGQWWLGPPAAWGQEILRSLDRIQAVVYQQRSGRTNDYGPPTMSTGWEKRYNARDRYRRDRYDDGVHIMNTQWVVPDDDGLKMIEVSYEHECWFSEHNQAYGFMESMIEQMRWYVALLDRADRILETEIFDGHECVGFEVSAVKYGDNRKGRFDLVWFDVETKLPLRIEHHGIALDPGRKLILIYDQFEYFAEVPANLFLPGIPDGYVNAHPDEIRKAREVETKGKMVFAEVPKGLRDKVVAALQTVETGRYRRGNVRATFSGAAWREDHYSGAGLERTHWLMLEGESPEGPFEPQGSSVVVATTVDYEQGTFRVVEHAASSQPRHPMREILRIVGLLDRADTFDEDIEIEGMACFGFEISAKKYGDNPDGAFHRAWFDAATHLPVKMEVEWPRSNGGGTSTAVKDQFEWDPVLPGDFFVPQIPPSFTLAEN